MSVLIGAFAPRIPEAAVFARANRVLLLRSAVSAGLDIALAGLPFEARLIGRSGPFMFPPDIPLRTCSAEDLIVLRGVR